MSSVKYSYGYFGYFLKYLGSLLMTIFVLLFAGLMFLIITTSFNETLSLERVLLLVVFLLMIPFCVKGAIYFFKYAGSFTMTYEFRTDGIKIKENNHEEWHPISNIESVLYLKPLRVFEISLHDNPQKLVLMNNGQVETISFIILKEFLFREYKVESKWF